jgi:hypothetical protein
MSVPEIDDDYPPEEAARRRDEAVKRMLNTPPRPHSTKANAKRPAHTYVVVDGVMRIAAGRLTPGEATVDLYRNLDDLRAGRVLEPGVAVTVAG